jgi:carboxyl-terminal processing protease
MNRKRQTRTFAAAAVLVAAATRIGSGVSAPLSSNRPPVCQDVAEEPSSPGAPESLPTTTTSVGQAYYCILDKYYGGRNLDGRSLLVPAFAALTQELQRRGLDQARATLPALTGKRNDDWAAFSQVL